ncbi:MAG: prolyl oligopeptidase family serine peptidase [Bacteroidota bacterium]|jgi:predicted peptidase
MKLTVKQKINSLFLILFFCVSLFPTNSALSQVNKLDEKNLEETMRNPWEPNRSVFLQDWLILGSIPIKAPEEIDTDFLVAYNGEANVQPVDGQSIKIGGSEMKWGRAKCKDIFDLKKFFQGKRNEDAIAYAYTTITRKEAGKVLLTMGTDDGVKVWVNGKMVHRVLQQRGITLDEDGIEASLTSGENHLLLKIQQGKGDWGFVVRFLENEYQLNTITGDIIFLLSDIQPEKKTLTVNSQSNLDQSILKQAIQMDVYTTGGKSAAKKTFNCAEPVVLNYKNWTDGVYEFRFKYKDVRGKTFFKYASWYKGDILAAAREIVNTAPGKNIQTPEASTHRMLSDMIQDRLDKNLQNPDSSKLRALYSPLMEFAEIKAKKQIRANGFVRLAYIDDIDNTPQFCRCYLPPDYNPSTKYPMVINLHGFNGDNPEYINWWDADKRHDDASDKYNIIYIEPHGRYNSGYRGIGDRDLLKCIEMAKKTFSVDDDRVYMMGLSMGGGGTLFFAERHPDLFAAIAPSAPGNVDYHLYISKEAIAKLRPGEIFINDKYSTTSGLESLINVPMLFLHGDKDQDIDVNYTRYTVRMLQRWNYNVQYYEAVGKGHNNIGLKDQRISWLLQHKRNASPKRVCIRAAELPFAHAYWVEVTQTNRPQEFTVVDAEVLESNMIRVDSKNAYELSLTPDKALIDYNKPVKVFWNGKMVPTNNLKTGKIVLKDEDYNPLPLHKTNKIAGPISDFQNTPFMVVIGTISNNSLMKKLIVQKTEAIVSDWKNSQKYEPRVKKDVDVTETEMKNYSLYLLGGPEDNKVSKLIFEKTPFQIKSDEIIIDGKSFKAKDAVLNAIYPNPFNNERYVNIVAATSGTGLFFFNPQNFMLAQFDYSILDGKIPRVSTNVKSDKIMVAAGFFNCNWKIDKEFLNEGDEELRSKCFSIVVDENLKTRVVGAVQPSAELMNGYAGTYQFEGGGPRVRIFIKNGSLMADVQGQGTLELQAISENEFFADMSTSGTFKKNEVTNEYEIYLHQMGREGKAKKVK